VSTSRETPCISLICHNSVTTQNVWFFGRDF